MTDAEKMYRLKLILEENAAKKTFMEDGPHSPDAKIGALEAYNIGLRDGVTGLSRSLLEALFATEETDHVSN